MVGALALCLMFSCRAEARPEVMSIGDSISIGYAPFLGVHPDANCRNTVYTKENLDAWLAAPEFALKKAIVWNNGLWNAVVPAQIPGGEPVRWYTTTDSAYQADLIEIGTKLVATGKPVYFVTTTPIVGPVFTAGREITFNTIAKTVLPPLGITIIDLYALTVLHPEWRIASDDVHYFPTASSMMAKYILASMAALP